MTEAPDELAGVLSDETSHLIVGHVNECNNEKTMICIPEIILLTLDPTEVVVSVLVVGDWRICTKNWWQRTREKTR